MRPTRPFRELLQEALAAAKGGQAEALGQAFREEAERHANLGPRGEDPVAQALALGRQALRHLARGEREEVCRKLSQALELHPSLGGGLAWELAEALCGDGALLPLRQRLASLRAIPPEARLLAFLDRLPREFWVEVLRRAPRTASSGKQEGAKAEAPSRPRFPTPPRRPRPLRVRFVYRPLPRKGPPGEEGAKEAKAFLMSSHLHQEEALFGFRELRRWVAPGLEVREVREHLYLRVLPEFWELYPQVALLVLEAGRARALAPLLPTAPSQPLPVNPQGGADLEAEVWSWEDLTAGALAELLWGGRFYLDLLGAWLWYGMEEGLISPEVVVAALRWLERGS